MKIRVRSLAVALAICCSYRSRRHCQIVCCADQWHGDQRGGTSRDDGRALSGAAGLSVLALSHL